MPETAEAPVNSYLDEVFDPEAETDEGTVDQIESEELSESDAAESIEAAKQISAPKDEGEKAKETVEQQVEPEIDSGLSDLLGRAEEYGLSKEQVEALGPDAANLLMSSIDKQLAAIGRQSWEAAKPPEKTAEQPVQKIAPETPVQQASESSLRLSEDDTDPLIAKFSGDVEDRIKAIEARFDAKVKALESENERLRQPVQQAQAREASELETKMDTFFNNLGEEYGELFGKGTIRQLKPDSTSTKARMEVWAEMNALHDGYLKAGRKPPSFEELQKRALHSLHPDKIKIQARKEVEKKVATRKASSVAKPTSRNGKPLSAFERAADFANRYYNENFAQADDDDI